MEVQVNSVLQQAYDQQYGSQEEVWRALGAKAKARNIIEITKQEKFSKVLEVGAGDGSILKILEKESFAHELYALEISLSGVEKIKGKNLQTLREVLQFNGYKMPYPDNHFDLVILSHVLEHVEYERTLLREIKRVSRMLVIEVPRDFRFGLDKKIGHFLAYGHINIYTPTSLKFLLRSENFVIKKELLKLYDKEVFDFMAGKNSINKLKNHLIYVFKSLMLGLPFLITRELFCNSITLLVEGKENSANFFKPNQ